MSAGWNKGRFPVSRKESMGFSILRRAASARQMGRRLNREATQYRSDDELKHRKGGG
jgi:hypothetical protein